MKLLIILTTVCATLAFGQLSPLAPNAPKDKPVSAEAEQAAAFHRAISPYVEKARKTYPDAKKRYLEGLPPKHVFFLVTRLHDRTGTFEQVFIEIRSISKGIATGIVASEIHAVQGFKRGQEYAFPENEMLDWLISKPDGTEEGNVVGNFLDTYKP
jgi:hypothetical protein